MYRGGPKVDLLLTLLDVSISMYRDLAGRPKMLIAADNIEKLNQLWYRTTSTIVDYGKTYLFMHFPPYPPKVVDIAAGAKSIKWGKIAKALRNARFLLGRGLPGSNPLKALAEALDHPDLAPSRIGKLWIAIVSDFEITIDKDKNTEYLTKIETHLKERNHRIIIYLLGEPNSEGKNILETLRKKLNTEVIREPPEGLARNLQELVLLFAKTE